MSPPRSVLFSFLALHEASDVLGHLGDPHFTGRRAFLTSPLNSWGASFVFRQRFIWADRSPSTWLLVGLRMEDQASQFWQLLLLTKELAGWLAGLPVREFWALRSVLQSTSARLQARPQKGYSWSFSWSGPFCDDRMLAGFPATNR